MANPDHAHTPVPTAVDTARRVRAGELSAREAVRHALARIAGLDPSLNAFTVVRAEEALREAEAIDAGGPGHDGPLAGVPVALKEEYDVSGLPTTLGGHGNVAPVTRDSEVVRRLRAAGAVIVGKTTMPEFGQFPICESARYGVTRNPWDPDRSPGGSSGGSAVAVAAGMVPIALGADGGGSLRLPAANCGVLGLKPTRGRVSPAPLAQHWYSLVTLGPIARTAQDLALVMDVISGNTDTDAYTWPPPERPYAETVADDLGRLRVLRATNPVLAGTRIDPAVSAAVDEVAMRLTALGHRVSAAKVSWPVPTAAFLPQFFAGMRVEAGQVEHPELLEPRTRTTVRLSRWAGERVVRRALKEGKRVTRRMNALFDEADLILLPTLPGRPISATAFSGRSALGSLLRATPLVSQVAIANVSGHPAISLPAGRVEGLPIGAQLLAPLGREDILLAVSAQLLGEDGPDYPPLPTPGGLS